MDVTLKQASSYDLTAEMGPFRLVAIGRAFHWMDRAATLRRCWTASSRPMGASPCFMTPIRRSRRMAGSRPW